MAKVTRVEIPPKPVKPEVRYQLDLSWEEAQFLYSILNWMGGVGRRGDLAYGIWSALSDTGGAWSADRPFKGESRAPAVRLKGDDE
jgi:hypothetical protein